MKQLLLFSLAIFLFACQKAEVETTRSIGVAVPWNDGSSQHPKNIALKALLEKYRSKGLPGISLLVNDKNGTWIGSTVTWIGGEMVKVGQSLVDADLEFLAPRQDRPSRRHALTQRRNHRRIRARVLGEQELAMRNVAADSLHNIQRELERNLIVRPIA